MGSNRLPEQVKLLREFAVEIKKEPRLDLDEFEFIEGQIALAMKRNVEVKIKWWKDGELIYNRGNIQWIDLARRSLELEDSFHSFELSIDEIVAVTIQE